MTTCTCSSPLIWNNQQIMPRSWLYNNITCTHTGGHSKPASPISQLTKFVSCLKHFLIFFRIANVCYRREFVVCFVSCRHLFFLLLRFTTDMTHIMPSVSHLHTRISRQQIYLKHSVKNLFEIPKYAM